MILSGDVARDVHVRYCHWNGLPDFSANVDIPWEWGPNSINYMPEARGMYSISWSGLQ